MIRHWLRAMAAGLVLVAILLGLPILLLRFGRSPLDGTGSNWEQIADLPTQAISDNVAFGLLTAAAWVTWAIFVLNVLAELASTVGGMGRWRVPSVGPFQTTAHRLVVALTMSASLGTSVGTRAGVVPILPTAAAMAAPAPDLVDASLPLDQSEQSVPTDAAAAGPDAWSDFANTGQAVPAASDQGGALPVVTVAPGDSPWTLAQLHLGDGLRWREIWEMNRGVPQPDGQSWVVEDLIRPGWCFNLPADATGLPTSVPVPVPAASAEPSLPPPDDESAGLPPADQTDPPLSAPEPGRAETSPSVTEQPVLPPATRTPDPDATTVTGGREVDGDEDDDEAGSALPRLLGVGGTLLAVGILRELRRRRARRAACLPVSAVPPSTPRAPVARELLIQGDEYATDRLEAAIAHLASAMRTRLRGDCPQPRVIQVAGSRIDVLLDRPELPPPSPWRPEASGLCWVLDGDYDLQWEEDLLPLPGLVTVGVGTADILIDLEAYGVVALVGDEHACRGLARSMAVELAARAEGSVTVDVLGDVIGDASRLVGTRPQASWETAEVGTIGTSTRLLEAGGWPHTWAARTSGRIYDGWAPHIWITCEDGHPHYGQALEAIRSHPGTGSAIVVVGSDPGYGLRIQLDEHGRFAIPDLGLRGEAQRVEGTVVEQLADLLDNAEEEPVVTPTELTLDATVAPSSDLAGFLQEPIEQDPYEDPAFDVLVRVCGPIRVDGGASELPPRETAVAAFVALNGEVDIERIRDAVWAGADISVKRVRNVISAVRGAVGDAVAFTDDHRLAPGSGLITDLELVRRRHAHAKTQDDPSLKANILRGALELVSGRVCWYPQSRKRCWTWIDLEDWIPHVESVVGTVARDLARIYLGLGDGDGARWALEQGVEAVGRRDELTILLVRAYELLGDEASARSVIRSHERYLNELGVDEYNEELLELLDRYATPVRLKATRY